ncbi:STAS domain-containing protein [Streptomyces gardneri]|uniref:STAS domain-containing protein n=1 Tax=Streptomyces gardneri TaxID=66892 RepID=UPI0035E35096
MRSMPGWCPMPGAYLQMFVSGIALASFLLAGLRAGPAPSSGGRVRLGFWAVGAAGPRGLDVDLSGVTFCDSSGLDMLLRLNRRANRAGKSLVLTALSPRVTRLLRLTGAEHLFTTHTWPPSPPGETDATTPPGQGKLRSALTPGIRR